MTFLYLLMTNHIALNKGKLAEFDLCCNNTFIYPFSERRIPRRVPVKAFVTDPILNLLFASTSLPVE